MTPEGWRYSAVPCAVCRVPQESHRWISFGPVLVFSTWEPCEGQKQPVTCFRLDLKLELEPFTGFSTRGSSHPEECVQCLVQSKPGLVPCACFLPVDTPRRNTAVGLSQAAAEVCPPWTTTAAQQSPGRLGN